MSILARASLRKATENILPQTCKTHGSQRPPLPPPSDLESLGHLWDAHREQRRNVGLSTGFWSLRPSASFHPTLLPAVVLLWATSVC